MLLAPRAGFEPATIRLTVECSTAELPRNRRNRRSQPAAYNKASGPCKGRNETAAPRQRRSVSAVKWTYSPTRLPPAGFAGGDAIYDHQTDSMQAAPSIIPSDIPALSDDECLVRLARAIDDHDSAHLDELARLI